MREKREISFLVDKQELKLLNEIIIVNEEIDDSLGRAKLEGDKHRLKFSYDAIEELLGFLAATSNHEKSERKQERLDKLYGRIEGLIKLSKLVKTHGKVKILKKEYPLMIRPRGIHIPPKDHPWRKFRLPGSVRIEEKEEIFAGAL